MPKSLEEIGLTQFEITTQVILEPGVLEKINPVDGSDKIAKAIAEALELTGRFRVNPYGWNFNPEEEGKDE